MSKNWHTIIMRHVRHRTDEELLYAKQDLEETIIAQEGLIRAGCNTPKYGKYIDELHYVNMEMKRRKEKRQWHLSE